MRQMNKMSKLPNGSRVISYMFGSCPSHRCSLHLVFSAGRYVQYRLAAIIACGSIAFDYGDYHPMNSRIQA
jgi:hypothetical protein